MSELYFNDYGTSVSGGITSSQTTIIVASSARYPGTGNFRIRIDNELMLVTSISGTTWTVTRGVEGTTATTHLNGASINHFITAGGLGNIIAQGGVITKLAETILSSAASTVSFSSISAAYRNLTIRVTAGWDSVGTNDFYMQFNGDTGSNYQRAAIYSPGSGGTPWAVSTYSTNQAAIGNLPGNTAGYPGCFTITVFDYARTVWNKIATSLGAEFVSTSQQEVVYQTFGWNSTAAINSILFGVSVGNFASGSVFSLYGEL